MWHIRIEVEANARKNSNDINTHFDDPGFRQRAECQEAAEIGDLDRAQDLGPSERGGSAPGNSAPSLSSAQL
jgi:hypothetical protein